MDRYLKIEPTAEALADLERFRHPGPLDVVSFVKMRRDLPDGMADRNLKLWRKSYREIWEPRGARFSRMSSVLFSSDGGAGIWDRLTVLSFPDGRSLLETFLHPGIVDTVGIRRDALEVCHVVIAAPVSSDRDLAGLDATASHIGERTSSLERGPRDQAIPIIKAALASKSLNEPFELLACARLRPSADASTVNARYQEWRSIWNEVAWHYGVETVYRSEVLGALVPPPAPWHRMAISRYPDARTMEAALTDPRVEAAGTLRAEALDTVLVMLLQPDVDWENGR